MSTCVHRKSIILTQTLYEQPASISFNKPNYIQIKPSDKLSNRECSGI